MKNITKKVLPFSTILFCVLILTYYYGIIATNIKLKIEIVEARRVQKDLKKTLDSLKLLIRSFNDVKSTDYTSKKIVTLIADKIQAKTIHASSSPAHDSITSKSSQNINPSSAQEFNTYSTIITTEYKVGKTKTIKDISISIIVQKSSISSFNLKKADVNFLIIQKVSNTKNDQAEINFILDVSEICGNQFSVRLRDVTKDNSYLSDLNPLNAFIRAGNIKGKVYEDQINGLLFWIELGEDNLAPVEMIIPFTLKKTENPK
jgi:hypothetical protein